MSNTIIQIDTKDPLFSAVFELRDIVLRQPLGLSLYDEDTSSDKDDITFVIKTEDSKVIACLMAKPISPTEMKLRQMAVAFEYQNKGLGKQLVQAAEKLIKEKNYGKISLHARTTAIPFYEKLAYTIHSNIFEEVGIPHVKMEKVL